MSVTIQIRRDTAANWTSVNPVLNQGEMGLETNTGKAKMGDGATAWSSLAYWAPAGSGGSGTVTSVTAGDSSIVIGGTGAAPVIETGTLDVIASDHAPQANWSNNNKKITSLTPGAASGEAVAFQQLPSNSSPLAIGSGGTGSGTQNFVDLTSGQSVAGVKTFTGEVVVPTPANSGDAVTKAYADAYAAGLSARASVNEATAAPLSPSYSWTSTGGGTLTGVSTGVLTVDGQGVALNDRVLVQNETGGDAPYNGIYLCTTAGAGGGSPAAYVLTRSTDMSTGADFPGAVTFCEHGNTNAGSGFVCVTPATVTLNTTAITWTQNSATGAVTAGTGLTQSGSTISLTAPVPVNLGGTGTETGAPANEVFAGPNGSTGAPAFRSLVSADIPNNAANTSGTAAGLSSTLAVGSGGTGQPSLTANAPVAGNGTAGVQSISTGLSTPGNVLTSTGSSSLPSFQALPPASTSTAGIIELDGISADIQPLGSSAAAGSGTKAAASNHVHPNAGLVTTLTPASRTTGATVAAGEYSVCNTATNGAPFTLTLSTPSVSGVQYGAKLTTLGTNADGTGYAVTIQASGTDRFNTATGATSLTLSMLNQGMTLQYAAGTTGIWYVTGDDEPLGQLDERYGVTIGTAASWTGTETVNVGTAQVWNITLTGNVTSITFTNAAFATTVAQNLTLYISQAASGGPYGVSGWTGVTWFGGGSGPTMPATAGALMVLTFQSLDGGQTWYGGIVSNAALPLPVAAGGTGLNALTTNQLLAGNASTSTGAVQQIGYGLNGYVLTSGGSGSLPTWGQLGSIANPTWTAADQGLIAWNYDGPASAEGASAPLATAGTLYVMAIKVPAVLITNILMAVVTNGATLTASQCYAALYQGSPTISLLGTSADQSSGWETGITRIATMSLNSGAGVNTTAGIAYVAVWFNGTTGPAFFRTEGLSVMANVGTALRWGTANTSVTTTAPSSLGTITAAGNAYWVGLS